MGPGSIAQAGRRRALKTVAGSLVTLIPHVAGVAAAPASEGSARALESLWAEWKRKFVKSGRVIDTGNGGISHTEGQGTAMLGAVAAADRESFDGAWLFARQRLQQPDGLHAWRWVPKDGVTDLNNASDGDLYIAWALLKASLTWKEPEYLRAAAEIVRGLRNCIVQLPEGLALLPGKTGFLRESRGRSEVVLNPSYWVMPALAELGLMDEGRYLWDVAKSSEILLEKSLIGPHGLPLDWLAHGDPLTPWSERPARFGYEAIRIPLYLKWAGKTRHPAFTRCARVFADHGVKPWFGLDRGDVPQYPANPGFQAIAQLTLGDKVMRSTLSDDYYASSLVLLAHLARQQSSS